MQNDSPFLSTLAPGPRERRIAITFVLVSAAGFLLAAPFARTPLPQVPAFLPMYQSALVLCDLLTAVLLFGQYNILRSRALLMLAAGYLFSAQMAVAHALSFPGLFAPGGLLGAGSQTTAWLYFLWHGGFPLFLLGYTLLKGENRENASFPRLTLMEMLGAAALAVGLAAGATLVATLGNDALPRLMAGDLDAPAKVVVAMLTWLASLGTLIVLWRRRPHSVLDLWLMIVLCVWIFDSALAAVLNHGRYDLGWYAGRVYGLLASGAVLAVLLLETSMLHARLAEANEGQRRKTDDLQRLGAQLQSANHLLAQKNEQLAEVSRLKSEFLANMSHELRTPLNAVIGFSEVLKDGLVGELTREQSDCVTDIYTSGKHLLALINDILDLSKIEAGQMTLDLEPTGCTALFEHSLSIVREGAVRRRVQLELDMPIDSGTLQVDVRKTKQIVYNLLSNAVKFSPQGCQVTLRVRRVARADLDDWNDSAATVLQMPLLADAFAEYLQIEVEDTGIGIAPEDAPRLFRMFSQLDSSLSKEVEGTGLGLALVERLARLHGGTVAVASTPRQGSRFFVWLPWRTPIEGVVSRAQARPQGCTATGRPVALLIEDNEHAAELLRLLLEPEGFDVVRVAAARPALDWLSSGRPSVVVLDILLPDMDGWDLLAQLKLPGTATAHLPVVIVSIVANEKKGFSLGASAVLQKPVSCVELLQALDDAGIVGGKGPTRVLVVDDDPKAVELVATYLAGPRFRVLRAHGGREGIEVARLERPDLIVLDLMMPEVNGFDVVEALRQRPDTESIPIMVVTAKTLTAQDKAVLNGFVAVVLQKAAFGAGDFVSEVRRAMAYKREASA